MLVVTKGEDEYERVRKHLTENFKVTCLGTLGLQVERSKDGTFLLNQSYYIKKIAERFGQQHAKPSAIPMNPGYLNMSQKEEKPMKSNEKYHSLVGALLYVAVYNRPDIVITTSILGRKVSKPSEADWTEAKKTLRYLVTTAEMKLKLRGERDLVGYVDADWAGDKADRKSNSGFIFQLGTGTISWTARKQHNYVQDMNANGTIVVRYCPTDSMVADALTKPLACVRLEKLRATLRLGFFEFEEE